MNKKNRITETVDNVSQTQVMEKTKNLLGQLQEQLRKFTLLIALIALAAVISVLSPFFLRPDNLINVLMQASINLIIALGMTFVIATAGIDLSVGSIVGLSGMIMAKLLIAGNSLPVSIVITLLSGILMGAVNGLLITRVKLPPFIATLGTMSVYRGITLISNEGKPAYGLSSQSLRPIAGRIGSIPIPVIIAFTSAIIAYLILTRTTIGEYTLAIGGNEEAVRLSGVPVGRFLTIVYGLSGLACALAGIVLTARLTAAEPIAGTGYELDAIAAVVIGGTSLSGGVATIFGTVIGALIMSVLRNGLNLLNIQSYYQLVAIGSVIVLAVAMDKLRKS